MEPDFSGWATKANLKCSDGRTIMSDAFKHMDGQQVPLVYQHGHKKIDEVLGHVFLKHTAEGTRADAYFNDTPSGQNAKMLVRHKDIKHLSIYANNLQEMAVKKVIHGDIREVSLVLAGANPGAVIDQINIRHGDGSFEELDDEAIIHTGLELELAHADGGGDPTAQDIYDSLTDDQKNLVTYLLQQAVDPDGDGDDDAEKGAEDDKKDDAKHGDEQDPENDLTHQEGNGMSHNVFDQTGKDDKNTGKHELSHSDMQGIFTAAEKVGSLKEAVNDYAIAHGITPMDILFPNFTNLTNTPQFNSRRMEWVSGVLSGTSKSPFSRVRTIIADITMDQARALGYIKGNFKKEEWISVTKRTTSPTTVYKKQKLDRDDIIDITDFEVVSWIKGEMDLMLKEEVARSILIGDGRAVDDDDKIKDPAGVQDGIGVRSILNEHELFATTVNVNLGDANSSYTEAIDAIVMSMQYYKGTGSPVFYTTLPILSRMLLLKDTLNRRLYQTKADLAAAMMVSDIVPVEVMETQPNLIGIIVNLADYNIGADKGGEVNLFDFFDIDYNQYKYLIETRISGALTKVKSALIIKNTAATNVLVDPISVPTWVKTTGVVTIPTQTGVVYKNFDTSATLTAGAQTALTPGQTLKVVATPASGYYFAYTGTPNEWTFTKPSA